MKKPRPKSLANLIIDETMVKTDNLNGLQDMMPDMEINNKTPFSQSQISTIINASQLINTRLQSRGLHTRLRFRTTEILKEPTEVYQNDKQIINITYRLLEELDLGQLVQDSQLKMIDEKEREMNYWKEQANKLELERNLMDRKLRNVERECAKMKLVSEDDINRRKTAEVQQKEVVRRWETYKGEVEREKKRKELSNLEFLRKVKKKKVCTSNDLISSETQNNFDEFKMQHEKIMEQETSSEVLELSNDINVVKRECLKYYGFCLNLLDCLKKLKMNDGFGKIEDSFVPAENQLSSLKLDDRSLNSLNFSFLKLLKSIQKEPFGIEDTFRFKRIGIEKQREIELLNMELKELKRNYEEVVKDMKDRNFFETK